MRRQAGRVAVCGCRTIPTAWSTPRIGAGSSATCSSARTRWQSKSVGFRPRGCGGFAAASASGGRVLLLLRRGGLLALLPPLAAKDSRKRVVALVTGVLVD